MNYQNIICTLETLKRFLPNYLKIVENNSRYTLFERTDKTIKSADELEVIDRSLENSSAYLKNNVIV